MSANIRRVEIPYTYDVVSSRGSNGLALGVEVVVELHLENGLQGLEESEVVLDT